MKPDVLEDLARFEAGDVSIADLEGRHGADVVATASLHADLSKAATREITPPEWALVADRMMAAAMTATAATHRRPLLAPIAWAVAAAIVLIGAASATSGEVREVIMEPVRNLIPWLDSSDIDVDQQPIDVPVTEPPPKRPVVTSTPTTSDATPTERTKVDESPTDLAELTRPTDRLTDTTVARDDHSDRTVDRATTTIAQRTETEPADRPVVTEPAPPDVTRVRDRDREADSSR